MGDDGAWTPKPSKNQKENTLFMDVPCGKCHGCRMDYSRDWAVRCYHESKSHTHNSFITLTYDDDHLYSKANPYSLDFTDFQKFIKRLRKNTGAKFKYFHCGEYGDTTNRPHYHALLFGYDFPDKKLHCTRDGMPVWTSEQLNDEWGLGTINEIGSVTWKSAAYVARYILKKQKEDSERYIHVPTNYNLETGEIMEFHDIVPEYTTMSNGIGAQYYEKYNSDFWINDSCEIPKGDGSTFSCRVPRYYRDKLKDQNFKLWDTLRAKRIQNQQERLEKERQNPDYNSTSRDEVREKVAKAKHRNLKRGLK